MKNKIKIGVLVCIIIAAAIVAVISTPINGNLWTEYQYFTPLLYVIIIAAAVNELQHISKYRGLINRFTSIKQDRDILKNINDMLLKSVRDLKIQRDETQKLLDYQTFENKALKRQLISAKANFAKYNKKKKATSITNSLLCLKSMYNCYPDDRVFTKGKNYKVHGKDDFCYHLIGDNNHEYPIPLDLAKTNFKEVK